MKKIPLSFAWLYALIGLYAILLASLPFCPWIQRVLMNKFHLRTSSFAQWSVLQFAPSMYNFANQAWVTENPVNPRDLVSPTKNIPIKSHIWTNHYPFWLVTFVDRSLFFNPQKDQYIYLQTRFQQQELWTIYRMNPQGQWTRLQQP